MRHGTLRPSFRIVFRLARSGRPDAVDAHLVALLPDQDHIQERPADPHHLTERHCAAVPARTPLHRLSALQRVDRTDGELAFRLRFRLRLRLPVPCLPFFFVLALLPLVDEAAPQFAGDVRGHVDGCPDELRKVRLGIILLRQLVVRGLFREAIRALPEAHGQGDLSFLEHPRARVAERALTHQHLQQLMRAAIAAAREHVEQAYDAILGTRTHIGSPRRWPPLRPGAGAR
mmetsp:Transcript_15952/g.60800  ORF Transcript_15952/g.60800 Transcript_15952/m.60800 type:complete len:231 (-) Transcript_15952:920-1612(-)